MQLHYIITVVSLPLLDCFVARAFTDIFSFEPLRFGSTWSCYFLVLAVAVGTYLLCAYEHLRAYLSCIIGFLYATLSWALLYYGFMLMNQLGDALKKGHPMRSRRIEICRERLIKVVI